MLLLRSVHHVHAEDVQVLSPLEKALRPLGREVALGVGHLSLQVEVDDQVPLLLR
jgi:hypothetical protein